MDAEDTVWPVSSCTLLGHDCGECEHSRHTHISQEDLLDGTAAVNVVVQTLSARGPPRRGLIWFCIAIELPAIYSPKPTSAELGKMTGAQLKEACADFGIDSRGCLEKRDYVALLAALPADTPLTLKIPHGIELRFAAYDIDPSDGLPCPRPLALFLLEPFPGKVATSGPLVVAAASECAEVMRRAHTAALPTPNPFRVQIVPLRDPSMAANTCCGAHPTMNGPHVDPRVRAKFWCKERCAYVGGVPDGKPI